LLAAAHDADEMLQRLKAQLVDGPLTGADLLGLGDWIDRVGRLAKVTLDARIAERKARLTEDQGRLLVGGLTWFISQLPLDVPQQAAARALLPPMLRSLSDGVVPSGRPVIEQ